MLLSGHDFVTIIFRNLQSFKTLSMQKPSALILAAGYSSRIKQEKFTLMFDEKTTFLERIVEQYKLFGCNRIVVVLNSIGVALFNEKYSHLKNDVCVVENVYPERGRPYSVSLGLKHVPANDMVFIQNIDNPFVTVDLLEMLFENSDGVDYVSPQYDGKGGHPVLLSQNVSRAIIELQNENFILRDLLKKYDNKTVKANDHRILANVNTKKDYDYYFRSGKL